MNSLADYSNPFLITSFPELTLPHDFLIFVDQLPLILSVNPIDLKGFNFIISNNLFASNIHSCLFNYQSGHFN